MAPLVLLFAVVLAVEPLAFEQPHLKEGVLLLLAPLLFLPSAWGGALRGWARGALVGPVRWLTLLFAWSLLAGMLLADNLPEVLRSSAVLLIGVVVVLSVSWQSYDRPLRIPLALLLAGLLAGGLGVAQKLGFDFPFRDLDGSNTAVSWFGNANQTGEFLAPLVPLALILATLVDRRVRMLSRLVLVIGTAGVLVSESRGALLALLLGVAAAFLLARGFTPVRLLRGPELVSLALGAALAVAVSGTGLFGFKSIEESEASIASLEYPTNQQRWLLARATLGMIEASPITGHGAGNYRSAFPPYRDPREAKLVTFGGAASVAEDPHNQYLLLLAEGGGIALILFLLFVLPALAGFRFAAMLPQADRRRVVAPALAGGLLTWLLVGLFRSPLENPPSAMLLFLLVGALLPYREGAVAKSGKSAERITDRILPVYLLGVLSLGVTGLGADLLLARAARSLERQQQSGDRSYLLHAERCLSFGASIDPANPHLLQFRAATLEILNRRLPEGRDELESAWHAVLRRDPWHEPSLIGLSAFHLEQGNAARARGSLNRLRRLRSSAERDDVAFLVRAGRPVAAARLLLDQAENAEVSPGQLLERADQARADGLPELAIALYEALLELRPFDGDAAFRAGQAVEELDRPGLAKRFYSRAHLGFALEHLGRRDYSAAKKSAGISNRHRESLEAATLIALADIGLGDETAHQEILGRVQEPLPAQFAQALRMLEGNSALAPAIRALTAIE